MCHVYSNGDLEVQRPLVVVFVNISVLPVKVLQDFGKCIAILTTP